MDAVSRFHLYDPDREYSHGVEQPPRVERRSQSPAGRARRVLFMCVQPLRARRFLKAASRAW